MTNAFDASSFDPKNFNPHESSFIKNPYPVYEWFRHNAPVSWVNSVYNSWWIFSYEDVHSVLNGTDLWVKNSPIPNPDPPPGFRVLANMPSGVFTLDNPRHDQVRELLNPLFVKAIKGIVPAAKAIAKPLLAKAGERQRFELIESYALPMPSQALCSVLGVAEQDWPLVMQWVAAVLMANDPTRGMSVMGAGATTAMALRSFYRSLIPGTYVAPAEGKMVDLMKKESERLKEKFTEDEIVANATTMSIAGYYSTTFLIGTGTLNLLNNPQSMELLREGVKGNDDALMATAVSEMLRYDGPVQLIDRIAAEDTEIGGVKIPKGQKVTAVVGSANWDEKVFANPEKFDIQRNTDKMLSFGDGIHRCLGEPMFKLVAPVAFSSLLSELPPFKLAGMPQWQTDPFLRAVSNLPLEFE